MTINDLTRWRLVGAEQVGCHECNDTPVYQCERCHRCYCLSHLRLVDWQVYQIALADADAKTVKVTTEDNGLLRGSGVRHLVCVNCAQELANFG